MLQMHFVVNTIMIAGNIEWIKWNPITTSDIIQIIYVLVTLGLLIAALIAMLFNRKQIETAVAGLQQAQSQYDEQNKADIVADVLYIKYFACLIIENTGHRLAKNVSINLDGSILAFLKDEGVFRNCRNNFLSVKRDIIPGKRIVYPLWCRTEDVKQHEIQKLTMIVTVEFSDNGKNCSREFHIPLQDEFLIEALPEERIASALENLKSEFKSFRSDCKSQANDVIRIE